MGRRRPAGLAPTGNDHPPHTLSAWSDHLALDRREGNLGYLYPGEAGGQLVRLLDLYCGAGGAAMGYHRAGFTDIVGIDIEPQPDYPFHFIQADALNPPLDLTGFDLIHASPPCQLFSTMSSRSQREHFDLLTPTRLMLASSGSVPFIIENVVGAPLRPDVVLCGSMFGLRVQRHRLFEVEGVFIWNPPVCQHWPHWKPWTVTGNPAGPDGHNSTRRRKYRTIAHGRKLLGVSWMNSTRGITQAIPPAYTEWLGREVQPMLVTP